MINYKLSLENETYPVEEIRILPGSVFAQGPAAKHFSFISPVRLTIGQRCALLGDSVGYPLLVDACMGFSFSSRFLVSGTLANTEEIEATTA